MDAWINNQITIPSFLWACKQPTRSSRENYRSRKSGRETLLFQKTLVRIESRHQQFCTLSSQKQKVPFLFQRNARTLVPYQQKEKTKKHQKKTTNKQKNRRTDQIGGFPIEHNRVSTVSISQTLSLLFKKKKKIRNWIVHPLSSRR